MWFALPAFLYIVSTACVEACENLFCLRPPAQALKWGRGKETQQYKDIEENGQGGWGYALTCVEVSRLLLYCAYPLLLVLKPLGSSPIVWFIPLRSNLTDTGPLLSGYWLKRKLRRPP